jgi:membrane-associated phospholipid phosphatase
MNDLMQALTAWDRRAFVEINHGLKNPFFDTVMPRISDLGLGHIQVLFILVCALLVAITAGEIRASSLFRDIQVAFVRRKSWIVPLLLAFAISGLGATAFKHTIDRDRPAWFYVHEHEAGRSLDVRVETVAGRRPIRVRGFLSGHTATSVALATAGTILFIRRKKLVPLVIAGWVLAGLISLSRIYIADHWPLDVVCGTILGILSGVAAVVIYRLRTLSGSPAVAPKEDSKVVADNSVAIG